MAMRIKPANSDQWNDMGVVDAGVARDSSGREIFSFGTPEALFDLRLNESDKALLKEAGIKPRA